MHTHVHLCVSQRTTWSQLCFHYMDPRDQTRSSGNHFTPWALQTPHSVFHLGPGGQTWVLMFAGQVLCQASSSSLRCPGNMNPTSLMGKWGAGSISIRGVYVCYVSSSARVTMCVACASLVCMHVCVDIHAYGICTHVRVCL